MGAKAIASANHALAIPHTADATTKRDASSTMRLPSREAVEDLTPHGERFLKSRCEPEDVSRRIVHDHSVQMPTEFYLHFRFARLGF